MKIWDSVYTCFTMITSYNRIHIFHTFSLHLSLNRLEQAALLTINGAINSSNLFFFLFFLASYSRDASCVNGRSLHILRIELKIESVSSALARASLVVRSRAPLFSSPFCLFCFRASNGRPLHTKELLAAGLDPSIFRSNSSIYVTTTGPRLPAYSWDKVSTVGNS